MYLIFDTETSGLPLWSESPEHPKQARIVQLGCLLLDEKFNEVNSFCTLIKPDGWTIDPKAENQHHISLDMCERYGVSPEHALTMFNKFYEMSSKRVAHNIKFDSFLLNVEIALIGSPILNFDLSKNCFCTMLSSTNVCKIPNISGHGGKYKWPKLSEAYQYSTGEAPLSGAHNALVDCRMTAAVLKMLIDKKIVKL